MYMSKNYSDFRAEPSIQIRIYFLTFNVTPNRTVTLALVPENYTANVILSMFSLVKWRNRHLPQRLFH